MTAPLNSATSEKGKLSPSFHLKAPLKLLFSIVYKNTGKAARNTTAIKEIFLEQYITMRSHIGISFQKL